VNTPTELEMAKARELVRQLYGKCVDPEKFADSIARALHDAAKVKDDEIQKLKSRCADLAKHTDCVEVAQICLCHQCSSRFENEYNEAIEEYEKGEAAQRAKEQHEQD